MNEAQEKPKKKWYKKWQLIVAGLVIIAAIISLAVWAANQGGIETCCRSASWVTAREQVQNAVTAYQASHNGSLPTLNGTYSNANCSNCSVVNISALLLKNGGMLRVAPAGLNLNTSGNDNCGGKAGLGCQKGNSYIWIVDSSGTVYSYCAGAKCTNNNSGIQGGLWP